MVSPVPVLSWSGGKDSALAFYELSRLDRRPGALLTTITSGYDRISMHGVRRALLHMQAGHLGVPLIEVEIPPQCTNELYQELMGDTVRKLVRQGRDLFAFGDLFLEDIRAYREEQLAEVSARAVFPLWGLDTGVLCRQFLEAGFRAIVVTVDPRHLDGSFCGRDYDQAFLEALPSSVDPMGENGEFHTFVYAGPIFAQPLEVRKGEVVKRDGFVFCDVLPAGSTIDNTDGAC